MLYISYWVLCHLNSMQWFLHLIFLSGSTKNNLTFDYVRSTLLAEEERILNREGPQPHNTFTSSNRTMYLENLLYELFSVSITIRYCFG